MIEIAARYILLLAVAFLLWQLITNQDMNARFVCALLLILAGQLREILLLRQASVHTKTQNSKVKH
ncbi:Uncharacterised protein [Candidatus Anstonella stagnisolia]|nr:Uncharacterised protein [Candidatus Anstonella stagnisolia]